MSLPAIRVENLWKEYVVGNAQDRHSTFYDLLSDALRAPLKRFRHLSGQTNPPERFWALQSVDLKIMPGEVVGIIGRNGAGKSTLLKVLSRITSPTKGRVEVRGRLASLLEVGTGFHSELSGRENIYLNGSILGMSRKEVATKFDEIVAFAEVDKFIDTPVKRYSSGMYVRLAFSVAAHLDADVLLVDEVLAVGDAEFQKRCLGKMREVSGGGRTVLFVSHNTAAIQTLCSSCVLLDQGRVDSAGMTNKVIETYTSRIRTDSGLVLTDVKCLKLVAVYGEYEQLESSECRVTVKFNFQSSIDLQDIHIDFGLENQDGVRLLQVMPGNRGDPPLAISEGLDFSYSVQWKSTGFAPGQYFCTVYAHSRVLGVLFQCTNISLFRVAASMANVECMSPGFTAILLPKYSIDFVRKAN